MSAAPAPASFGGRSRAAAPSRPAAGSPAATALRARRLLDGLFLLTIFTITFAKVRWEVAGTVSFSDLSTLAFLGAYAASMVGRPRRPQPRTVAATTGFFLVLLVVYLLGWFDITEAKSNAQFWKGFVIWAIHFLFLIAGVALIAQRGKRFFWRCLAWFCAGLVVNCVYGVFQLAVAQTGGNLDSLFLNPITGGASAINLYGAVNGTSVYRPNAVTGDPNHLGIMLLVPILVLLPLWLRMERTNPWYRRLPWLLGFMFLVQISTLSRSALLGLAAGLVVLLVPYRRRLRSGQLLKPLAGVAVVLAAVIASNPHYFWVVLRTRIGLGGTDTSANVHFSIFEFIPQILDREPLFGLGLNTFSVFYEEVTGKTNWGPHSYLVALIVETGLIGLVAYGAFIWFVFSRLRRARMVGAWLAARGDADARRVSPLAWGLTAALVATMVANLFYLTMQFYYFYGLLALALAAHLVFGPRAALQREGTGGSARPHTGSGSGPEAGPGAAAGAGTAPAGP